MEESHRKDSPGYEERIARVVWAAHILYYLAKKRSNIELQQIDVADEEEVIKHEELDVATEAADVLQSTKESIRSKFLNCISQLLSPAKGWNSVTATALREREDFVEIDVARNDCFGISQDVETDKHMYNFGSEEADYYRKLQDHLATTTQQALSCGFELIAITYTHRRVDHWVKQLQVLLSSVPDCQHWDKRRWSGDQIVIETWTNFTKLLYERDIEATKFRERIVQRVHKCVVAAEVHQLLRMLFEAKTGSKLWYALKMLARPVTDCRMILCIANQQPQFRDVRISPIALRSKTRISPEFQIDISDAWARLISTSPPASELRIITNFGEQFKQDCAESYSLHAEIQLYMHYENRTALTPTFSYFGCSKKACLLCEDFLHGLPSPIAIRGRHGICYPAWGVPPSTSAGAGVALINFQKLLVSRIKTHLPDLIRENETQFLPAVRQSTLVSDFSDSTIQDLSQREEKVESAKKAEMALREERLILEGATSISRLTNRQRSDLEPHGSCVMCNKVSTKRCKQCQSCYYCSLECQKSDWSSHKLLCKDFSTQIPRPSLSHKRAIFFPVDLDKPRMIWLPCKLYHSPAEEDDKDEGSYEVANLHPHLGADRPCVGTIRYEYNSVRDRILGTGIASPSPRKEGHSVTLKFRDAFSKDGSAINRSILKSVGTSGTVSHHFSGPIVALREMPYNTYGDITLADFRDIIDMLVGYAKTDVRESNCLQTRSPRMIHGVKICCFGEIELHGSDPYVLVDVPWSHPIRHRDGNLISSISKRLGLPLKLWKDPDIRPWMEPPGWRKSMGGDSNHDTACLIMETDPDNPLWGWSPLDWKFELGNVLAVRADDEDLTVDDLRMMCHFATRKLRSMFEDALGGGLVPRTKQEVLDFITRENMVKFREMDKKSGDSREL